MSLINKRPQVSYVPRKEVKIPASNPSEFHRNNKVNNTNQMNNMDNFEKLLMNRNQNGRDNSLSKITKFLYQRTYQVLVDKIILFLKKNAYF